ncbi:phage tail tape measure protein [Cohnella abietis]|uniref:Phage tail tape measure protein domain-containing protein n=1 Tax=Cohnella abietis TaxID=2507935 RepID=A0A3T1D387_9BACL|nr:hypothetical protein [Cohnella abietis]BBI32489.1 hypothetical protein KCTCHS21_18880 [Cohnella abietis]
MGARDISKTLVLKDGTTSTLNKVGAGTVRYKKQLQDLKKQGEATWSSLRNGIAGAATAIAGYLSVRSLISYANSSAAAAKTQLEAEAKLSVIMRQRMGATNDVITSVKDLADAQEKLGVVSADAQISGAQELSTYLEKSDTLKTLIPTMNDLVAQQYGVAASSEQVTGMASMLGKVMDGQVGALSRYGFTFSKAEEKILKFGKESERAALLTRIVKDSIGNMNAELGKTDDGKLKQTSDALGGLQVTLGKTVIYLKKQFAGVISEYLPGIQAGVQGVADSIRSWADNGGINRIAEGVKSVWEWITTAWDVAVGMYNFVSNNWSLIGPIVYGIVGAFAAYKLGLIGMRVWTMATTAATFIATTAQLGLNAAIRANPLGFIITLIGLAIAAGTLLVQNWETVKLALMNTWNVVVGAAEWGVNQYLKFANFMIRVYKFAWDSIKFAGISIWNGILSAGEAGVNGFIRLVEWMVQKALDGVNGMIRNINSMSSWLGLGDMMGELTFGGLGRVDFSGAKGEAEAPKWDNNYNAISDVDFSGAKFSGDSIAKQSQKAQDERNKKKKKSEETLANALDQNTAAIAGNTKSTDDNTGETKKNTAKLNGNQSAMDIADGLLGRIERHMYAT